ncbi:MAG: hypothetical protein ACR2H0_04900 [Candidatus Limnocylindrales bacterium]
MNEPEPRNVTPEDERQQQAHEDVERRADESDWTGQTWTNRGRNFPWLGILLVLVGIALLVQAALPPNTITAGTVLLLAIGAAMIAGWLFGGSWFAAIPGLLLLALGVARLISELKLYSGPGITALSLAGAFVLIWAIGLARERRSRWPLVAAVILGIIGLIQVFGQLSNIPELGVVWPVVIIVVGVLLLISARRR